MSDRSTIVTDPPELLRLVGEGRTTVPRLLRARTAESPERPFLTWSDQQWTYREALKEVRQFSGWILSTGQVSFEQPRRVVSFLSNCPEAVWTWLGSLLSGATYIPLNRAHRGQVLQNMLIRSRSEILVTDEEGLDYLPDLTTTSVRTVLVVESKTKINQHGPADVVSWNAVERANPGDGPDRQPGDTAEVMFTSGTTGLAKAVVLSHNQLCRGSAWVAWSLEMTEYDVIHGWLPLFHIAGQLDMVLATIVAGGCINLQPTYSRSRFWEQVEAAGATLFIGFSNVLEILSGLPANPNDAANSLRAGIIGHIPPSLHAPFEARFGVRLYDVYGMTEMDPLSFPMPSQTCPVGSVGKPSPDIEIAIMEEDQIVSSHSVGQIVFRPRIPDVMISSYEGDEAAFVEATVGDWFHTGDLGRFDESGYLYFVERRGDAIRRRGENISSFEIEHTLSSHPAVHECVAVGVPSNVGEEDVKIIVVPVTGATLEPMTLRTWCVGRMAAYMVPRYIELVDSLPREQTGKVQKQRLIEISSNTFDSEKATDK